MGMTRSRRTLLALSATVVLVAAACGDDPDAVGSPPVIRLAAEGATRGGAALPAAEGAAVADKMSMFVPVEYVLAGDLPALDTPAGSWIVPAGVSVGLEQVRRLAEVLGVRGEPREQPADWGGGWAVGPDDGTAPSLWVSGDGLGTWWYSPAWDVASDVRCVVSEPMPGADEPMPIEEGAASDEAVGAPGSASGEQSDAEAPATSETEVLPTPECAEIAPPANVPSAEQAEALARQLFGELGLDLDQVEFETYRDDWNASVTAYRVLEGVRSPLSWYASYGGDAELQYAGGSLAEPQRSEDYPRIGTAAGFERLQSGNDPIYGFGGWSRYAAEELAAADVATEPALGAPEPIEPIGPVEPMVVTITGVEEELVQVWDVEGAVHLLPGYAFLTDDGARYVVSAIPAELVVVPEPVPVEPVPGGTEPGVGPVDSVEPGDTDTGVTDTGVTDPAGAGAAEALAAEVVGLGEDDAVAAIEAAGLVARVIERDGESLPATMDYREDRVNLSVTDGTVTAATVG